MNTLREQLDALPEGPGNNEPRAYVESEIAALLIDRGDYGQALVHLGGARRGTGEQRLRDRVDMLTGLALLRRGEVERAEPHLERQLESARERRDLEAEARALLHLAEIYRRRGEAARASRAVERARFYFESHPDAAALAATYTSRAELALTGDDVASGEALALRAAELAASVMAVAAEAAALVTLGRLRGKRGAIGEAEAAIGRAIELLSTANMPRELAEAYFAYGHLIGDSGDERDAARVGSAATFIARAQELFREHGALADLERVRQAFQRFGRRATDQVAAAELRELGEGLRASRLDVTRQVHKLVDAVEQGIGRVDGELPAAARGKLHAISREAVAAERAVSTGVEALAEAEARLVAALQAMVVERESVRTLLDLCRALTSIDDPQRLTHELCKMAAQLTGADRGLVALVDGVDGARLDVRASLRMSNVAAETGWRDAMDGVLAGGGARLVGARAGVAVDAAHGLRSAGSGAGHGRPTRDAYGDEPRLGHALVTPLRAGEQLLGAVYVDKELCGGLFTPHDLELLTLFCAQTATILQSAQTAATQRLERATQTAALEAVDDGVIAFDASGKLVALHGAVAHDLGLAVGASLTDLPALAALVAAPTANASATNGSDGATAPLGVTLGGGEYLASVRRSTSSDGVALVVTVTALSRAKALAQRFLRPPPLASFAELVGRAPSLRRQLQRAESAAAVSDGGVLVVGEAGSGKTLVTQALHRASTRAGGPFVVVDCAAVPRALMEVALFGVSGGATGQLEAAAGGTLVLESLDELPLALQVKLAGALQERRFRRAGS
ncbi:MAG TPA: sigma 54-interacting transcriptional regulator, partial [Polyangia bacterium]|nr:sigma 54-interacting transcriptional regulator [Polyangia bacterium]